MLIHPAPLDETVTALRSGQFGLHTLIDQLCDRVDMVDQQVEALLPEAGRRQRLHAEADALLARYPDPATRPPLDVALLGVKDIFHLAGRVTRAGSQIPPETFAAPADQPEALCVGQLRAAGALLLAKTVTTEFAFFEPGPTRNPHNLAHTPGGSSSGSAAAVAAGLCQLALGTQTIGS
ncbi:MAG TPA: amidase family protein, partial [Caldilineaceae bacterium]|nr:amidase family protein [Caldilineaceae bacterium]